MLFLNYKMEYKINKNFKHKFDFEIGYLIKSPCKECSIRSKFPKCIDECEKLDKIQTKLTDVLSSSRRSR